MDHWAPRSFGVLSERLTARNGILLIGGASFAALVYTGGNVRHLVVMYSINVFLAFSLSLLGMIGWTWKRRRTPQGTIRRLLLFGAGLALSVLILLIMVFEKFWEGAWLTLIVTGVVVLLCFVVHRHYDAVGRRLEILKREMKAHVPTPVALRRPLESGAPTAGILVAEFDGLGLHTMLNVQSAFQGHFRNFVFLSVGVLDSAQFKGEGAVDALIKRTRSMLDRYVNTANAFGVPAEARFTVGTDVVDAAEGLCLKAAEEIPKMTFFAGKLVFSQVGWLERVFHNETAFAIQRRLQWAGRHMVILPVRVR